MNKEYLERYTDYLLSSFGYATATARSRMVEGQLTHDQVTRFLSSEEFTSKGLWSMVKPTVWEVEHEDAVLYLACSDITVKRGQILATYQKRWPVEVFHKSAKQNASLGKASVRTVVTQNNHVFAVLYAVFKLECLSIKRHLNRFSLRARLYLKAIRVVFDELQTLKAA